MTSDDYVRIGFVAGFLVGGLLVYLIPRMR